ncbi:MAG: type II toxin-antitoxin system HicB family antitoxin [Chloroflexota bacterium]|jgi:antitoxin HicB|nr:type II toxin-antitoxin system HicB family antitoxin [Chloroflexia bacterium]MDQ3466932.1 type II toxin-antitoxin system HicB family antitoxin [Chloroflexota bacterium]
MRYSVVLVPGDRQSCYVAYVPVIPGCVSQGHSVEDALDMAQDAASAMIESMVDHDEEIPTENTGAIIASIDVAIPAAASAVA